jgi:hypothetical protein
LLHLSSRSSWRFLSVAVDTGSSSQGGFRVVEFPCIAVSANAQ